MFADKARKVAVTHDLSGMGGVPLTVVIPILLPMGFRVCPLPTMILSNRTQHPHFTFLDLTDEIPRIIAEWERLEVELDVIYIGYLKSPRQIQIVSDFTRDFCWKNSLTMIDPVLGGSDRLYSDLDETMVTGMQQLITHVDAITPNLTEFFYLLGCPYEEANTGQESRDYLHGLSERRPGVMVMTSMPVLGESHKTSVYTYNRTRDHYWKATRPYLPAHCPSTGDIFASITTGALLQGDSPPTTLDRVTRLILQGVRTTSGYGYDSREDILLGKIFHNLGMPVQDNNYKLI